VFILSSVYVPAGESRDLDFERNHDHAKEITVLLNEPVRMRERLPIFPLNHCNEALVSNDSEKSWMFLTNKEVHKFFLSEQKNGTMIMIMKQKKGI